LKDGDHSVPTPADYSYWCHAVAALGAIGDRRAFDPLRTILDDETIKEEERRRHGRADGADLRSVAAAALGRLGDARAFDILLRILDEDEDPGVGAYAAQGLGFLGDRRAIPALTKATQGPTGPIPTQQAGDWDALRREAKWAIETLNGR
jgi:HEAT repeat protein